MAKDQKTEIAGVEIDDDAHYEVQIVKRVEFGHVVLRKGTRPTVKGKVLKEIAANVGEVRPLAP